MKRARRASASACTIFDLEPLSPTRQPSHYRFAFVLNTTIGNMTRYVNLRKYATRDPEVDCRWTPITHVASVHSHWLLRLLPGRMAMRIRVATQVFPALRRLNGVDAVMLHLFEAELLFVARSYFFSTPLLVSSTDEAPAADRATYPLYPDQQRKPMWRRTFRLRLDRWRASRMRAFIPFTSWAGRILERACGIEPERIHPIHVGLDLELWNPVPVESRRTGELCKLLFVGADFERKGGSLLLSVFKNHLAGLAELHLVSTQAPTNLPDGVRAYRDLFPNDPRLIELYERCDVLVLPTHADLVPWVLLEAMAMKLPVVSTDVGAIPEIVRDDVSGIIVPAGDADALLRAVLRLIEEPALRDRMGEHGRERIEKDFNAELNVPRILDVMKSIVKKREGVSVSP